MENIQITTAQNVSIQYEIASLGDRIAAFCIDYFGIKLGYLVLCFVALDLSESLQQELQEWHYIVGIILPVLLYDVMMEIFNNGQTFGKAAMKIKVVMLDGSQPSIAAYLLRWVFRLIELDGSLGSLALWFYLFSQKGQRLGDLAAGTTVVKLRHESFSSTIYEMLYDNYTPVFAEAALLLDVEAGIIREILESHAGGSVQQLNFDVIAAEAQKRIVARLQITTDMGPISFLDTVLKDYNYFHAHSVV